MQNIILFENNHQISSQIIEALTGSSRSFNIVQAQTTEELITRLTSGKFDAAIIDYDELGSLFKLRPYILRHLSGLAPVYFLSSEITPMMTLNFSILQFIVFKKPSELNLLTQSIFAAERYPETQPSY